MSPEFVWESTACFSDTSNRLARELLAVRTRYALTVSELMMMSLSDVPVRRMCALIDMSAVRGIRLRQDRPHLGGESNSEAPGSPEDRQIPLVEVSSVRREIDYWLSMVSRGVGEPRLRC